MRDHGRRAQPTDLVKVVEASHAQGALEARPEPTPEQKERFEALYKKLFPRLLTYSRRKLGRSGGYDAVQEAVADIWVRWPAAVRERPTSSFFYAAVRNRVARALARQAYEAVPFSDLADEFPWLISSKTLPSSEVERKELAAIADTAVASMPPRCREVWVSMRENGMRYAHVAESLGLTEVTVRRHMSRALAVLHEALVDAGYREATALPPKLLPAALPALLPAPADTRPEEDAHD